MIKITKSRLLGPLVASWELTMRGTPQRTKREWRKRRERNGVADRREKTRKEKGGRLH